MNTHNQENEYNTNNLNSFWAGLLLGGLAGAGAMLLLAPQSGKKTQQQIRRKGRELREQTAETIDDGMKQVNTKAHKVTTSLHKKAEAIQQLGQDMVDEQKERWSPVIEAGKTAVHGA